MGQQIPTLFTVSCKLLLFNPVSENALERTKKLCQAIKEVESRQPMQMLTRQKRCSSSNHSPRQRKKLTKVNGEKDVW